MNRCFRSCASALVKGEVLNLIGPLLHSGK